MSPADPDGLRGPARVRALPRVAGFDAVAAAARDFGRYSSLHRGDEDVRTYRQLPLEADPPLHTAIRALLVPLFSRSALAGHRSAIGADARALVAPLAAGRPVEVVTEVALPLVVGSVLGVLGRREDAPRVVALGLSVWGDHEGRRDGTRFHAYLDELVADALAGRGGAALTHLGQARLLGRPITEEELRGILGLLLAAGRDTVVDLLAGVCWVLVARHDLLPALHEPDPHRRAAARVNLVEEVARTGSGLVMERIDRGAGRADPATAPHVALDFPSANADPAAFPEPARIVLDRPAPRGHLAFGLGPHACLGAGLARLEAEAVLDAVLAAAPAGLLPGEPVAVESMAGRTMHGQPVPGGFRRLVVRAAGAVPPATG